MLALWLGLVLNYGFYEKIKQFTPYQGIKATNLVIATVIVIVSSISSVAAMAELALECQNISKHFDCSWWIQRLFCQ